MVASLAGSLREILRTEPVLDLLFLAIGLGFFAAGWLYLYACDRL